METLAALFVGKPLHILLAALPFVLMAFWPRSKSGAATRPRTGLRWAAAGWLAYAAWEAIVRWRTPEADIRVDLLLIWPTLTLLSIWGLLSWGFGKRR